MPESIGQRLKEVREGRRLTIEQAAGATRIRPHYLQALENDDYSVMVSAAQGRGFLRLYASYLGVNLDEIVASAKTTADVPPPPIAATPAPAPANEPAPASAPTPKAGRPGFWARLLRRSPAEPAAEEPQPQPEPVAPAVVEEPVFAAPAIIPEEPATEENIPASKPVSTKRVKRAASETEPKKTRATRSATGKKKQPLTPRR